MAIGRRRRAPQQELFVAASDIRALDNPFYRALNGLLEEHGFDEFAEEQCREFYSGNRGRPGVPPGVYFRMLMVGYLEGLGSERGIAWRCADSFSLREFLGCGLAGNPPEHSTLSKTRKRLSVEAHGAVFGFVLERLRESGLLSGRTLGVDATTLEANAAMRTIVRRDDGTEYEEWLEQLAAASGIETPTREDLAKLDRKRPNKGSNKDWEHPHDPEARITKMKDGRTRLAHKLEQAVDMETGAVVAATVQTIDGGDTASLAVTLDEAEERLAEVGVEAKEVVADKGYHSNRTMTEVKERGKRSYVSEPNRGRRKWKGKRDAQKAVYANRRRIRGDRGKRLLRRRGEKVERAFAHMLETGGMRRVHLRGRRRFENGCSSRRRGLQPRAADAEAVRLRHPARPAGSGLGPGRARGPRRRRRFVFYSPFHSRFPAPVGHYSRHSRKSEPQTPKSAIPAQPGPLVHRVRHAQATSPREPFIHGLLEPCYCAEQPPPLRKLSSIPDKPLSRRSNQWKAVAAEVPQARDTVTSTGISPNLTPLVPKARLRFLRGRGCGQSDRCPPSRFRG